MTSWAVFLANPHLLSLPYPEDVGGEYGFTRTVVAVPEPESIALLFAGLAIVGMTRLSRRKET